MRPLMLLVVVFAACKGTSTGQGSGTGTASGSSAGSDGGVVAKPAPVDMVQAKVTLGCLFDKARFPREVLTTLGDIAPAPVVRMAVIAAIDRARPDGLTPTQRMIADGISALGDVDDLDGLRAMFAMVDEVPGALDDMMFKNDGPKRARVGARLPREIPSDRSAIARETALSGDLPGAIKLIDRIAKKSLESSYEMEPYLGALVAVGRLDDARAQIAAAKPEDRLGLAGEWLRTAIRQRVPLKPALDAVIAEVATAPEGALNMLDDRAIFRRAHRFGRGGELVPLYQKLVARVATFRNPNALREWKYELATATGDAKELAALASDAELAKRFVALRSGPLDEALKEALDQKYPLNDLVGVWTRSIADGADPTFGARLAAKVCPRPPPPVRPATPAAKGFKVTVTQKSHGMRQECDLHDVVVRLTDGTKLIAEDVLEGECHGACTAKEKRAGKAEYERILREIEKGEASESETDYNFTHCIFSGPLVGRIDRVADRDVALIADHFIGPHDVDDDRWQIATEVCGELLVSEVFARRYAGAFSLAELKIHDTPDHGQIIVEVDTDRWHGVAYRLTLPECPRVAKEQALETE